MENTLHVLAIDDHAMVLQSYFSIFRNLEASVSINFKKACDCKSGRDLINSNLTNPFDIAVLDYSIPPFPEENLHSGGDMAALLRATMPGCKIIMMTMHKEFEIFSGIFQTIVPEGFINKNDCTTDEVAEGFSTVINGGNFYSPTIQLYKSRIEKGIVLEKSDIQVLQVLAKGLQNKDLTKYIPQSEHVIEQRKRYLKNMLEADTDDALLLKARQFGFI